MLMPGKYLRQQDSLLYLAGVLLRRMTRPMSVSELWEVFVRDEPTATFERYVLCLDLLHMMSIVGFNDDGLLVREVVS